MLVVDDEPDANITLKTLLEENGFETDAHTDPLRHYKVLDAASMISYFWTSRCQRWKDLNCIKK